MQSAGFLAGGVILLLLSAALTGCTGTRPAGGAETLTVSPAGPAPETPAPPAISPPAGPPGPAAAVNSAPAAVQAPDQPLPPAPRPEPTPVAKTFQVEPLVQVTGDPWESYAGWPQYPFEYRSLGYIIWVPYNTAAYEQAKFSVSARNDERTKAFAQLYTLSNDWWYLALPLPGQEDYYRGLINDPANDLVYDSILTRMREIRDQQQLDDNEYAELIARFVQRSIPNRNWQDDGRVVERYPIETIGDRGGNRADKSLLLAGLLAREGYGVALIYFPDVNLNGYAADNMLVGIQGDGAAGYDGYLGIDPATESFFGVYAPQAASVIPDVQYFVDSKVIKVSDGKKYMAGPELRLIWDRLTFMYFYDTIRDFTKDLRFVRVNRDDRQRVFEYLAYLGPFGYE